MKKSIIAIIIILAFFLLFRSKGGSAPVLIPLPAPSPTISAQDTPQIVSTNPNPLEDTIIAADQIIEITFSHPLENVPEFKTKIEPKTDYKVELSSDRKTAKIIPALPFELGTTYTLFIMTDSKFEGGGRLPQELNFHFRTVRYRGF